MKRTQRVFIDRRVAFDIINGDRRHPYVVYPEENAYVREHRESFITVEETISFSKKAQDSLKKVLDKKN